MEGRIRSPLSNTNTGLSDYFGIFPSNFRRIRLEAERVIPSYSPPPSSIPPPVPTTLPNANVIHVLNFPTTTTLLTNIFAPPNITWTLFPG